MKRLLLLLLVLLGALPAYAQIPGTDLLVGRTPIVGGSVGQCLTIGTANKLGSQACGGGGGTDIIIGTTVVSGGTTGRVLYDNGGLAGEYAITGSGNVVMSASPTLSGTVGGALTFSGGLTLSSALTYGGVTLSNAVTGTGAMVLANTPTLTTPVLGAATGTSVVLTGGANILSGTGITAGGSTTGFEATSTANFGVFFGSGAPTISTAQGSLYLRSDGTPYYNTNGSTGWQSLLPSGSWVLISSASASAATIAEFTGFDSNLYDQYEIVFWGVIPVSGNGFLSLRTSSNGGSSYDSGANNYLTAQGTSDGGYMVQVTGLSTLGPLTGVALSTTTNYPAFGRISMYSPQTSQRSAIDYLISYEYTAGTLWASLPGAIWREAAAAFNAVALFFNTSATFNGEFRFYGRRI